MKRVNSRVILVVGLAILLLWIGPAVAAGSDAGSATNESDGSYMDGYGPPAESTALTESDVDCMKCHQYQPTNNTRRPMAIPDPKHPELQHGNDRFWCLKCHDAENRSKLQLANGTSVDFGPEKSSLMCGGCHGPVYDDWKNNIHGTWSGSWEDPSTNRYCVDCHNPHGPEFEKMAPDNPPRGAPSTDRAGLILPPDYNIAASIVIIMAMLLIGYAIWPPDLQ